MGGTQRLTRAIGKSKAMSMGKKNKKILFLQKAKKSLKFEHFFFFSVNWRYGWC